MSEAEARGRFWEDTALAVCCLIGLLYGVAETMARMGVCIGKCVSYDASFPWGHLITMLILAAPKTLGRVGARDILIALVGKLPGRNG